MTRFLLIRHATNNTVGATIAGRMPGVHLNEEGKTQAVKLAERLKGIPVNAVYSSPLERCLETAKPLTEMLGKDLTIIEEFTEIEYGKWTNCALNELKDDLQFKHWNSFRSSTRIPGGEMMIEVQARMIAGLKKIQQQHSEQTIAIISHGDPIRAVVAFYAGMPLDFLLRIEIEPASVSVIDLYDEFAQLIVVNDTGLNKLC